MYCRSFHYQTTSRVTYPAEEAESVKSEPCVDDDSYQFKPHGFDADIDRKRKPRQRNNKITRAMEPLKCTPAFRAKGKYKPIEGNINPAIRYGLIPNNK